jgi:hypothetical protein
MEEVDYLVRESRRNEKRQARSRISKALRDGQVPGTEDVAKARGLVIRERHNSIFSDAWIPLAIIILIIGLVANRNAAVLAVGLGLFIIVGISTWWRRFSLLGVTYERSFDQTQYFPRNP